MTGDERETRETFLQEEVICTLRNGYGAIIVERKSVQCWRGNKEANTSLFLYGIR